MSGARESDDSVGNESGGASIRQGRDPRFSALLNWVWGAFGVIALSVGGWIATSISELNNTLTRAVVQIENQGRQIDDLKGQITELRSDLNKQRTDLAVIQGTVERGLEKGRDLVHGQQYGN